MIWSRDGKYIVFVRAPPDGAGTDIWVNPMVDDGKPFPFVQRPYTHGEPRVSPNSRWLAYMTDETDTPPTIAKTQIAGHCPPMCKSFDVWKLGRRDSNPDKQIQSCLDHISATEFRASPHRYTLSSGTVSILPLSGLEWRVYAGRAVPGGTGTPVLPLS